MIWELAVLLAAAAVVFFAIVLLAIGVDEIRSRRRRPPDLSFGWRPEDEV